MQELLGKVTKGLEKSKFFMTLEGYQKQLQEHLGNTPFPGTLNLTVDVDQRDAFLNELEPITIPGFWAEGKQYNKVTCYRATIKNIPCLITIPKQTSHGPEVVEIISEFNLREKLGLNDYDEVAIQP
jgi:riboflavin kinase|tara:strand:- start:230 stop:610 length:381 start_codon:yes stop_codon:yes gene_type:complete